jgi:type IV secretory pathway VirB10-like protein
MNETVPQPRLRVSVLVVGVLLLVGIGALVVYGPGMIPLPELPTLPSGEPQVEVVQLPPEFSKPIPRATVQPVVAPIVATEPPARNGATPASQQTTTTTAPPLTAVQAPQRAVGEPGLVQQLNPFAGLSELRRHAQAPQAQPPAGAPPKAPPTPAAKPAPKRWAMLLEAPKETPQAEPKAASVLDGLPEALLPPELRKRTPDKDESQAAAGLIQPARWAIPENPLKTIYRSQTITCRLLQGINSEIPGTLKLETTTPILDKFGYDTEILPVKTLVIAQQVGQPQYGNKRLRVALEQLELPSGEVIALKANIGEEDGSNGLTGKVNNHYGKLLLATGISAILNIGVRSAGGTPGTNQFFRSPLQDAAQDVGQSVQQETQRAVDRELRVPPTIEREGLTFCTINLLENIQFNRPPHVAR